MQVYNWTNSHSHKSWMLLWRSWLDAQELVSGRHCNMHTLVKRLYDTFHEPFKRVSARPNLVVPDTPDREKAKGQPSSTDGSLQDVVEKPDAAKKKISDVRSALTAAFAKYSEKIRSQGHDAANEAGEATSSSAMEVDRARPRETRLVAVGC